jgi:hypothetical protein
LEFIYTDPYLNILSSPFGSFIQQDSNYYLLAHSRDTISITAGTEFSNNSTLKFYGSFSWISSGEHNKDGLKWNWDKTPDVYNERTPTGIAENKLILNLGAQFNPFSSLVLNADISGIASLNNKHVHNNEFGVQAALSIGFKY